MRHILESQQFDRESVKTLYRKASDYKKLLQSGGSISKEERMFFGDKILAAVYFEGSLRTRCSLEMTAHRLGMRVISIDRADETTSAKKGESLQDAIRVLSGYRPNIVALRHPENGAAAKAAAVSSVPIINMGDGSNQHPTQALADIFTIQEERGCVDGLHVMIGGDLAYGRTARSLAFLLAKFRGIKITFFAKARAGLDIGYDVKEYLDRCSVPFSETDSVRAFAEADVVYWTRIQQERMDPKLYEIVKHAYRYLIDVSLVSQMKLDSAILHPLPKTGEIAAEVDADPRAAYYRQAENGLYVRMALLSWMLRP